MVLIHKPAHMVLLLMEVLIMLLRFLLLGLSLILMISHSFHHFIFMRLLLLPERASYLLFADHHESSLHEYASYWTHVCTFYCLHIAFHAVQSIKTSFKTSASMPTMRIVRCSFMWFWNERKRRDFFVANNYISFNSEWMYDTFAKRRNNFKITMFLMIFNYLLFKQCETFLMMKIMDER